MPQQPAPARATSLPTIAAVLLAAGLAGAIAYIGQLRGQLHAAEAQLATQTAQLKPFIDAARAAYPDADPSTALRSIGQRLGIMVPASVLRAEDFLPADKQVAMVGALRNEPDTARKVWFLVAQNNPEAMSVQAALQTVFEQAGWPVVTTRAPYPLKPGVFLLAGDEQPPAFVNGVNAAFTVAGFDVPYLTGYRSFVTDRKATNPNWVGPELAADQPFTIVIGARPKLKDAAAPAPAPASE